MIASVAEPAAEVIDGEMAKLGGEVTHRPADEVVDQLEASEEAATPPRAKRGENWPKAQAESKKTWRNAWEAEGEAPRLLTSAFWYGDDDFPCGVVKPKIRPRQSRC